MSEVLDKYNQWHTQMSKTEEMDVLQMPWYKTVIANLPDLNGKKVLEVGCGRGVFASYLANRYPEASITGVDFSPEAIRVANDWFFGRHNLNFLVADAEQLSFNDQTFDYYISCETIEHVMNPARMISEVRRVLKREGEFIITTENYFNAYLLVWFKCWILKRPFESGCGVQPHENFFLFPMLLWWFYQKDLKVKKTMSNHYQWLVWPGIAPARLCTRDIRSPFLRWLAKPFGRHFAYLGYKL